MLGELMVDGIGWLLGTVARGAITDAGVRRAVEAGRKVSEGMSGWWRMSPWSPIWDYLP